MPSRSSCAISIDRPHAYEASREFTAGTGSEPVPTDLVRSAGHLLRTRRAMSVYLVDRRCPARSPRRCGRATQSASAVARFPLLWLPDPVQLRSRGDTRRTFRPRCASNPRSPRARRNGGTCRWDGAGIARRRRIADRPRSCTTASDCRSRSSPDAPRPRLRLSSQKVANRRRRTTRTTTGSIWTTGRGPR